MRHFEQLVDRPSDILNDLELCTLFNSDTDFVVLAELWFAHLCNSLIFLHVVGIFGRFGINKNACGDN